MKKVISLILTFILLAGCCTVGVQAIADKEDVTQYPVIIVPGYSSSNLIRTNENGETDQVWGLPWDQVIELVLSKLAQLGIGLGSAVFNQPDYLAKLLGTEVDKLLDGLKCNPDGTSKYNMEVMFPTAEESNSAVMYERYDETEDYQFEVDISRCLRDYIDRDMVFNFNNDWRMGAVENATRLDAYIQEVKEMTGAEKVNLFGISHGGQVTGTYLTLFGYKQDVDNAVMNVPALGGACILYDIFQQTVKFDEYGLLYFIEHGMRWENDFHWLLEAQQLGFLDEVLNKVIPYLFQVAGNWGSLWDFCPSDIYEDMKDKWLDDEKNAELIRKSDYMHYTVMPKFYTELQKCNDEYGMNVNIIAGTDINSMSGKLINSDGIIGTEMSTGAKCTAIGERFSDGYTQINECGGKNKVSPAMTVDVSTGYLPDNTWCVEGLFHGMMVWDDFTRELLLTLLLTDEITDVYSDPDYPQFHASSNASYAIWAGFDSSVEGMLSSDDKALIIENKSISDYNTTILAITCDGVDLDFDLKGNNRVAAGERIAIPFTGEIPAVSGKVVKITISYCVSGSLTPLGERTFSFTLDNGEAVDYDQANPTVSSAAKTPFEKSPFSFVSPLLKKLGMFNFVSMMYTIFTYMFKTIGGIFA